MPPPMPLRLLARVAAFSPLYDIRCLLLRHYAMPLRHFDVVFMICHMLICRICHYIAAYRRCHYRLTPSRVYATPRALFHRRFLLP